jgi:hypothetical protein
MSQSLSAMVLVGLLLWTPPCKFDLAWRALAMNVAVAEAAPRFITVRGQQFIDSQGRQLLFHGAALINKRRQKDIRIAL